MLKVAIKNNTK